MTEGIHAIPLREGNTHKYGFCCEISVKQRSVFFLHLQLIGQKTFQPKNNSRSHESLFFSGFLALNQPQQEIWGEEGRVWVRSLWEMIGNGVRCLMMTTTIQQRTRSTGKDELTPVYSNELNRKYHKKEAINFRE